MYGACVFDEKRRNPTDDLATVLAQAEIDGDRLSDMDLAWFFLLLINAGGDTTRNLVGGGMHVAVRAPEPSGDVCSETSTALLPTAVEELLRYVSPVVHMRRTATRDTEIAGAEIAAGDKVVMFYGSANRDAAVFPDPDRLDVGRTPNDHLAFGGGGPHFCLGAPLGADRDPAMMREILARLPDIEPAGEASWPQSNFISGPTHLPVRFTPAARRRI